MTLKQKISVMQHFENGGKIERLDINTWTDDPDPIWNWQFHEYRIKEKHEIYYCTLPVSDTPATCKYYSEYSDDGAPISYCDRVENVKQCPFKSNKNKG